MQILYLSEVTQMSYNQIPLSHLYAGMLRTVEASSLSGDPVAVKSIRCIEYDALVLRRVLQLLREESMRRRGGGGEQGEDAPDGA